MNDKFKFYISIIEDDVVNNRCNSFIDFILNISNVIEFDANKYALSNMKNFNIVKYLKNLKNIYYPYYAFRSKETFDWEKASYIPYLYRVDNDGNYVENIKYNINNEKIKINNKDIRFDNPCFYYNENPKVLIISHEGSCDLILTPTEYDAFKKLGIEHTVQIKEVEE